MFLLGKFTSDHIEKEFGKLRQGSGAAYFIIVQQVFEKVNIPKTSLILSLDQNSYLFQTNDAGHQCDKCSCWLSKEICILVDDLPTLEKNLFCCILLVMLSGKMTNVKIHIIFVKTLAHTWMS